MKKTDPPQTDRGEIMEKRQQYEVVEDDRLRSKKRYAVADATQASIVADSLSESDAEKLCAKLNAESVWDSEDIDTLPVGDDMTDDEVETLDVPFRDRNDFLSRTDRHWNRPSNKRST